MRIAWLLLAVALVAGCGGTGAASDDATPRYDLTITFWPNGRGGDSREATLQCDPDGGSHPDPKGACDVLLQHEDALQPTPGNVACTEIYGGPQLATINGPGVSTVFSRTNGCEIGRWEALKAVLELPPD
jgi:hypothetical protein